MKTRERCTSTVESRDQPFRLDEFYTQTTYLTSLLDLKTADARGRLPINVPTEEEILIRKQTFFLLKIG